MPMTARDRLDNAAEALTDVLADAQDLTPEERREAAVALTHAVRALTLAEARAEARREVLQPRGAA